MLEVALNKKLMAPQGSMMLDLQLDVPPGKLVVLFGPSGAGKTSVLRMLAGLMKPDRGHLKINGETWYSSQQSCFLRPQERSLGFVFQDYALFPNMTVRENLLFALDKGQSKKQVDDLVELIELGSLQDRRPNLLSGGQQQRVALARALVRKPDLLLLDEPLSALDQTMRAKLQAYLLDLHHKFKLTTFLVSHDVQEVNKMADLVLILKQGQVVKSGDPNHLSLVDHTSRKMQSGKIIEKGHDRIGHFLVVRQGQKQEKVYYLPTHTQKLSVGDQISIDNQQILADIRKI